MTKLICITAVLSLPRMIAGQAGPQVLSRSPFVVGETLEMYSAVLDEPRILNIYLPPDYSPDSARSYPVIYLLDGSADEDFIHIAGLIQFGTFPWIRQLPESILVGVANVDRRRDFTYPTTVEKDKADFPTTGRSAAFIDFVEKELQPFIETHYRTNAVKSIIGQSLGGLVATEMLLEKPGLFTHYLIISPSLWWDNESLLRRTPAPGHGKTIYIAVGKEGQVMKKLARRLSKKVSPGNRVMFEYFPGADHANILHLAVYDAFEKVFGHKE